MIRQNEYVIYKGIEYIYRDCDENKNNGLVRIVSHDRRSLADGFFTNRSEEYMKDHGFRCFKDVPRSEITEAYDIRTHAVYKGVVASIVGCLKPNWIGLLTACLYNEDKEEFLKKVNKAGFKYYGREQGGVDVYAIDVSLDDPDLQLIQKRKELDISKL
mgnify:FL=1